MTVLMPTDNVPEAPSQERIDALMERVSRARTALTVWVPFFGHLLLKLNPRVSRPEDGVNTAGVCRDRTLILNVDFCEKLTDPELVGLLCHEVMHPAYMCFERQGSRNAIILSASGRVSLWNVAHDYAINLIIDEMIRGKPGQIKLPDGGCLDHKYANMSAEEIYDALIDEAKKNGGDGEGDGEGGSVLVLPGEDGEPGGGTWGLDDIRPDQGDTKEGQEAAQGNEASQRELDSYWKVAVVEAAQIHEQQGKGDLPGGLKKLIKDLVEPKVSWRDVLSRWVGENGRRADFSYRRPARRSESVGEFLPSLQKHGVDDLVVLWDTSGSMNGREQEIISEVIAICEDLNMTLRVICCDTMVHSDQSDVQDPEDVDVKGGGGSNFIPAFHLLHEEGYQGVVVAFTDGYISVPTVKPIHIRDCLWVIWERDVDPTGGAWGEVIRVDADGNV